MKLIPRDVPPRTSWQLEQAGMPPLMARLLAARGIEHPDQMDDAAGRLLAPSQLKGCEAAAQLLADTLDSGEGVCIVADYDCDGATACAVGLRGLRMLGFAPGQLHHVVPDRVLHGYGLTPPIVPQVLATGARVLVTVDNGMASHEAVRLARAQGLRVLITDHHLPVMDQAKRASLPEADVIVNPNQPECDFPSKAMVGVGVMFYVLLALRAELRRRGRFDAQTQPRLDQLLDLVALGTVADVGRLDDNNRRLVSLGLKRIRSGRMQPGVAALFEVAGRNPAQASAQDFGFAIGPRINAAGRLADMGVGITCLSTDHAAMAMSLAHQLDGINRERRVVESGMREQAEAALQACLPTGPEESLPAALCVYHPSFHEGVVGIVASRLKDRFHRPTFVFAPGQDGCLKGSGRSIPGFHLRDALDLLHKQHPTVLKRFGGHAMAAGCTIDVADLPVFEQAFSNIAQTELDEDVLQRRLHTDGPLPADAYSTATVELLEGTVWGQGFEPPLFQDEVEVVSQRLVGERHLKLSLRLQGQLRDGIWFGRSEPLPPRAVIAYRLGRDEFQGRQRVQMLVEGMANEACS